MPETNARYITEKEFLQTVKELARSLGWLVYHPFYSQRSEAGWPDLCMVRHGRCIVAELKREAGKLTTSQEGWLAAFRRCPIEVYVWRPSQLDEIEQILTEDSRG